MILTAVSIFHGSGVLITAEGKRHLGAALGTASFVSFVSQEVSVWKRHSELEVFTDISICDATTCSLCCFLHSHGIISRWNYLVRCIPDIGDSTLRR